MATDSEIDDLARFMHEQSLEYVAGLGRADVSTDPWDKLGAWKIAHYRHVARAILIRERTQPRQHPAPKRQMEYCR